MLVRGPPGSGKTTLSLALLEAFPGRRIMVTSRVGNEELHREFPWLGTNGGRDIHIIDTTGSAGEVARARKAQGEVGKLVRGASEEPSELASFLWLPPAVQQAWSELDDTEPSMVVVDSWDALIEAFLGRAGGATSETPNRAEVERVLLRQMAQAPVHLVLILEREEQTQLDYLVHGVLQTSIDFHEDRMERWLRLRKLRGVRIENALYPYTLEGAKFECIDPLRGRFSTRIGRAESEPDPSQGFIWPGCRSFAESFGRLPLGHWTLIEMDAAVPGYVAEMLSTPMIAGVLEKGGPVLILPEGRPAPASLWEALRASVPKQKFLNYLRIVSLADAPRSESALGRSEFARNILAFSVPKEGETPPTPEESPALKFLHSGGTPGAPGLVLVNVAGLHSMAAQVRRPITAEAVGSMPAAMREMVLGQALHGVVVGRTGDVVFEALRPAASLHLAVRTRQGRVLIHGVVPWTNRFLLVEGREPSPYSLLRVV